MSGEFFTRYELKYLIDWNTYQQFIKALMPYMAYDKFGKQDGMYQIVTLYFESPDYKIYYETVNKLKFRQKLRLRVYNDVTTDDQAFFEIKQKHKRVVNKRRTMIALHDAYDFIDKHAKAEQMDLNAYDASNFQILKEIDSFQRFYELTPKLIVSYERQAFQGLFEDDLRVTFDYNLRCRGDDLRIENGPHGQHFVDEDHVIMEVKMSHSVPLWLSRLLSEFGVKKNSVSKYCTSTNLCDAGRPALGHTIVS